ncbi:hypothetical protein [Streptomyces alboniger]|uniref:hypothetical protein n=1 Tax=Streptomyces alboniger TaxID=132473 RepID=UPI000ACB32F0|nr:hypothetical protein [Streptomyces alboniger]
MDFESWVLEQSPFDGYGSCPVASCSGLAASPLKLCRWHELFYQREGRPGGAVLPEKWARYYEVYGKPVPVTYADRRQFDQWSRTARSETLHGQLNLRGLRPLMKAEIQWGLFKHTEGDRARWPLPWVQDLVNFCRDRDLGSLADMDVNQCTHFTQMIARETLNELRLIYFTPETTREAGFIETDHFGIRFPGRISHYDLTGVSQRWLRDVLWDYLAAILRSPKCPRTGATFDHARRGIVSLSAFLEADAREGGHDPNLLQAKHMETAWNRICCWNDPNRRRSRPGCWNDATVTCSSSPESTMKRTCCTGGSTAWTGSSPCLRWSQKSGESQCRRRTLGLKHSRCSSAGVG